jgi:uncharacterized membrane protein HdeD (DUF308 family)
MVKSMSKSLILRGSLGVAVGILAIAWPGITVLALVLLFAIYAFGDGALQLGTAFTNRSGGWVVGHLLFALIDIAAAVVTVVWPGITAEALTLVVAFWAFAAGFVELWAAFRIGEAAGTRAMFVLGGLVSIAFGVVLSSRPDLGALSLALVYGLFSLSFGVSQIALGVQLRHNLNVTGLRVPDREPRVRSTQR